MTRPLVWRPETPTEERAWNGLRGIYTIRQNGNATFTLSGMGHDNIPMLALTGGRRFATAVAARLYADRLDRVRIVEPEASGV